MILSIAGASSFVVLPSRFQVVQRIRGGRMASSLANAPEFSWSPQDLTKDRRGFLPIPDDDYVKVYQRSPELHWPVEFFLIVYRRTKRKETQVLVRESANGTSKWGLGSGVPATRWLPTQGTPPLGYKWSEPRIRFEASGYPEFPQSKNGPGSWTYDKIDICEDAFNGPGAASVSDPELEQYARKLREEMRTKLSEDMNDESDNLWEYTRASVVKRVLDNPNSVSAIQGTLRMSGVFARRKSVAAASTEAGAGSTGPRYVALGKDAPDDAKLVQSMRVYTMFPQMPDPMPLPSTSAEELQKEIATRATRMAESGRDPHKDRHGRTFTHISTSNPSNTSAQAGVYRSQVPPYVSPAALLPCSVLTRRLRGRNSPEQFTGCTLPWTLQACRGLTRCPHWTCWAPRRSGGNGSRCKISRCSTRTARASAQRTRSRRSSRASSYGSSSGRESSTSHRGSPMRNDQCSASWRRARRGGAIPCHRASASPYAMSDEVRLYLKRKIDTCILLLRSTAVG